MLTMMEDMKIADGTPRCETCNHVLIAEDFSVVVVFPAAGMGQNLCCWLWCEQMC